MSNRRSGFCRCALILLACGVFQTCGDSPPTGPDSAGSIEELERSLAASGHLECRDLVRDLWFRLGSLSRDERLGEVVRVAQECVRGIRFGMLTVLTTTTGEGTDPNGYQVTLDSTTLPVPANGTVSFEDVKPGRREVALRDVAGHCRVVGGPRQSDVVTPHRPGRVAFEVVCGQGGEGPPPLDDPGYVNLACSELALGRTSAVPFDPVTVNGIPEDLGRPLGARVVDEVGQTATFTFIESTGGSGEMTAPFHPSGLAAGGAVTLTVTDGIHACPAMAFTIQPLPAAPGAFSDIVTQLQEIVRLQAQVFGFSTDQLETGDPATLPPQLWPAAVTWSIVGDPTNPNSLASLTQGGLSAEELDLLDRIVARLDIAGELATETAELQQLAGSASLSRNPLVLSDVGFDCVDIMDAEELDFCMSVANTSEFKQAGAVGETLSDLGKAFGLLGLIQTPVTQTVSTFAGIIIWLRQVSLDAMANILPSRFVPPMTTQYWDVFLEDEEGPGDWVAFVNATSMGWTMDQAIIEAVFQFVGAKGGGFTEFLERFDFAEEGFDTAVANYVLTEVVNALIGATGGAGFAHVEAKVSGPVDISDPAWSDRVLNGQSVVMRNHNEYDPVEVGLSLLQIRSKDSKFGFQQILSGQLPIDVKAIQVHIAPDQATVVENQSLVDHFTVTVTNSRFPEMVEIDPSVSLAGSASIRFDGGNRHIVSYVAPPSLDPLPDLLTVRHTATTGARDPVFDPPERLDTAVIGAGEVEIMPSSACLGPGETQQFQVSGLTVDQVVWSVEGGGSITETGGYTAPGAPADVLVIATHADNPAIADTADVRVGDCSCFWSVSVGGTTISSTPGDEAEFVFDLFDPDMPIDAIFLRDADFSSCPECDPSPTSAVLVRGDAGLPILGSGTYTGYDAFGGLTQVGQNPPFTFFDSRDLEEGVEEGVIVDIVDHTATSVIGTAVGMVELDGPTVDPRERPVFPFSASFAINAAPDFELGPNDFSVTCEVEE